MKNSQKGFVVPLLVVIAVLVIGGGVYIYVNKQKVETSKVTNKTLQQDEKLKSDWMIAVKNKDIENLKIIEEKILRDTDIYLNWLKQVVKEPLVGDNLKNELSERAGILLTKIGAADATQAIFVGYEKLGDDKDLQDNFRHLFEFITNAESEPIMFDYAVKSKDLLIFPVLTKQIGKIASDSQIIELWNKALTSTDERQRFIASVSVTKVATERNAPIVRKLFSKYVSDRSLNEQIRNSFLNTASSILGEDGSEESISVLLSALNGADDKLKQFIYDGLFRIHNPQSLPVLEKLALTNSDPKVRQYAIYALGNYPINIVMPILTRLSNDQQTTTDLKKSITFIMNLLKKKSVNVIPN